MFSEGIAQETLGGVSAVFPWSFASLRLPPMIALAMTPNLQRNADLRDFLQLHAEDIACIEPLPEVQRG